MPDAATLAVLRDCLMYIIIALALGSAVFAFVRSSSLVFVGDVGLVPCRAFGWQEAVVAGLLITILSSSLSQGVAVSEAKTETTLDAAAQIMTLLTGVGMMLFIALFILVFLRILRGHDLMELFGLRHLPVSGAFKTALKAILPVWFVTGCFAVAVNTLLTAVWPEAAASQETVQMFQKAAHPVVKALMVLAAVISAPLVEEIIFRGFLYPVFKRFTDAWVAAPLNALLFAVIHLHVGSFIPLTLLALAFILAYEVTGCLLVPIFMHALFNAISTGLLLSGVEIPA
jgi:uncharacterized protein